MIVLSSCGSGSGGEPADSADPTETATASARPSESSATPIADDPLEPFCADLTATLEAVPPLDPNGKQIAAVKSAIEEARASLTGKIAGEVDDWYSQTTDLAVAQFNRANDEDAYTNAWAEWTMGAKIGLLSECSA